jgi:hypothetical protein
MHQSRPDMEAIRHRVDIAAHPTSIGFTGFRIPLWPRRIMPDPKPEPRIQPQWNTNGDGISRKA